MLKQPMVRALLIVGMICCLSATLSAEVKRTIPNELKQSWPWELVYFDLDPAEAASAQVVHVAGEQRPVQIEPVQVDGQAKARAWFIATVEGEWNEKRNRREAAPESLEVSFAPGQVAPGIEVKKEGDYHLIDNGVYEFRLRHYAGKLAKPIPLNELPHFIGGMRVKGTETWDGRAWWEGSAQVIAAHTRVVQQGPVFIDYHITLEFADAGTGEMVNAMPLANGKQTYKFEPNELPGEQIEKKTHHYEAVIRFVMGEPWIDVNERFHFPGDPSVGTWGIAQYWLHFGKPTDIGGPKQIASNDHIKTDTALWTRWFEYDTFGGNTGMHAVPAEPREMQKGRPFAQLRPRWHQGGGGAQEMFLTSGGRGEWTERGSEEVQRSPGYDPENPAVGIVAAFASKWVEPYGQTIAGYAYDQERGVFRFPLRDARRANRHYAQRAYGLVVGPRKLFDDTNKMNALVRRQTDWTLVAQIHKYILSWERDPAKAGPHILATGPQIEALQKTWASGANTAANAILKAASDEKKELETKKAALQQSIRDADDARKVEGLTEDEKKKADAEHQQLRNELRDVDRRLGSDDFLVLGLITGDVQKTPTLSGWEGAGLWLDRRYQDDFLNPTGRPTRNQTKWGPIDLFASGRPIGGGMNAALAYIHTDLDAWPGWHNGWSPGNPNFHTDKYMIALYIGAAMLDHPHAAEWVNFGEKNFQEDMKKVFLAPDGVGYECPGYSGYSMKLQAGLARIIYNTGLGNPFATNPLVKKSAIWHRKLITPYDVRIDRRHEAPIGDTHRWDSGLGAGFAKISPFFKESDPEFASELVGTWEFLKASGAKPGDSDSLMFQLIDTDLEIKPMDVAEMDWSSGAFYGFGAIMRNNFGTARESHLTYKAGPTRGHYHNDENSYHFYSGGTPISLDYNCSYSPRGDHAALHNTMTFGRDGRVNHNRRNEAVEAMEQLFDTAYVGAFATSEAADVVISERAGGSLTMYPVEPNDHEFARDYPSRDVARIIHRRLLVLVKHPVDSKFQDYLVVREETQSKEAQQLNIHLLAREAQIDGNRVQLIGQLDKDMIVEVVEATDPKMIQREWFYFDSWMRGDGTYSIREGESVEAWDARMAAMMKEHNVDKLPLPGWKPTYNNPDGNGEWFKQVRETKGRALMMPRHWSGTWTYGECQIWLRLQSAPGTPITWVLYPYPRGGEQPKIERLADGKDVRLTLGGESEEIYLATDPADGVAGQVVIKRNGESTTLIPAKTVGPLGTIERKPIEEINLIEE